MATLLNLGNNLLKRKRDEVATQPTTTVSSAPKINTPSQPSPLNTSQTNSPAARSNSLLKSFSNVATNFSQQQPQLKTIQQNNSLPSMGQQKTGTSALNNLTAINMTALKPKTVENTSAIKNQQVVDLNKSRSTAAQSALGDRYKQIVGNSATMAGMAGSIFAPAMKDQTGYQKNWYNTTGDYRTDANKVAQNYLNYTYENLLDSYNNASKSDRAEIKANLDKQIVRLKDQYENLKDEDTLNNLKTLDELSGLISKYGGDSGKNLGQQLGDYVKTGGIAKSYYDRTLRGWQDMTDDNIRLKNQMDDSARQDLGAVGVGDTATGFATDFILNAATGGAYNALNASNSIAQYGANLGKDALTGDDRAFRKWDRDENGDLTYRAKTGTEYGAEGAQKVVQGLWALAGRNKTIADKMPGFDLVKKNATGEAIGELTKKEAAKEIGKYLLKETPWAAVTTGLDVSLENLANGEEWNKDINDIMSGDAEKRDAAIRKLGGEYLKTFAQDAAVDAGSAMRGLAEFKGAGNMYSKNGELISGKEVAEQLGDVAKKAGLDKLGMTIEDVNAKQSEMDKMIKQYQNNEKLIKKAEQRGDIGEIRDLAKMNYELSQKISDINSQITGELKNGETEQKPNKIEQTKQTIDKQAEEVAKTSADENKQIAGELKNPVEQKASDNLAQKVQEVVQKTTSDDLYARAEQEGIAIDKEFQNDIEGLSKKEISDILKNNFGLNKQQIEELAEIVRQNSGIDNITDMQYAQANAMLRTDEYTKDTGYKGKDIDPSVRRILSNTKGTSKYDPGWTEKFGDVTDVNEAADMIRDARQAIRESKQMSEFNGDNLSRAIKTDESIRDRIAENALKNKSDAKAQAEAKAKAKAEANAKKAEAQKKHDAKVAEEAVKKYRKEQRNASSEETAKNSKTKNKKESFPTGESGKKKTSTRSKKATSDERLSETTRERIKENLTKYSATTDEGRAKAADNLLSSDKGNSKGEYLQAENDIRGMLDSGSDDGTGVFAAQKLVEKYSAAGNDDAAERVEAMLDASSSKYGQRMQALRAMASTPEGIAANARRAIRKGGKEIPKDMRKVTSDIAKKIADARAETESIKKQNTQLTKQIEELRKQIDTKQSSNGKPLSKEHIEKAKINEANALATQKALGELARKSAVAESQALFDMEKYVKANTPDSTDLADKFSSVYRAGMLTGGTTHTGNFVSNAVNAGVERTARKLASGIDAAKTFFTGKERSIAATDKGGFEGFVRGLEDAVDVIRTGESFYEQYVANRGSKYEGVDETHFNNKIVDNTVGKATRGVMRLMNAGDLPFRWSAYESGLRSEAKLDGINKGYKGEALDNYIQSRIVTPDADLKARALKIANKSVYDYDTIASDLANRMRAGMSKTKGGKVAATILAPFVKVPSAVASSTLDLSPIGTVNSIVKKVRGTDWRGKEYTSGDFAIDMSKSFTGAGLLGAGAILQGMGAWTGSYPDDEKEKARWEAEGIKENCIKIGDTQFSVSNLGPIGAILSMGAELAKEVSDGADLATATTNAVIKGGQSIFGDTWMSNLVQPIQALNGSSDIGDAASKYIANTAGSFIPNIVGQAAKAGDDKERAIDKSNVFTYTRDTLKSKLPGARQTLNAKVDTYGNEIKKESTLPLGEMWDPLKQKKVNTQSEVGNEVDRLKDSGAGDAIPSKAGKSITLDKEKYQLSMEQQSQYQKDVGKARSEAMQMVMNSAEYKKLTDEQKVVALNEAKKQVGSSVNESFAKANGFENGNNTGTANSGLENVKFDDVVTKSLNKALNGSTSISSDIDDSAKSILKKKSEMSDEAWKKYIKENDSAEYEYAVAKYQNDVANGKVTDKQKITREKELQKKWVQSKFDYDTRDVYGLSSNKTDMQKYLNGLSDEDRASTVEKLNALNRAMYEYGSISASTFKSRYKAINNASYTYSSSGSTKKKSGSSGGISASEAKKLASAMSFTTSNANKGSAGQNSVSTKRKMSSTRLKSGVASSSSNTSSKKITVKKGIA